MTADDLMRLINRYVEACDDLGDGLFEKPLTTTDALHAKATALHGQILDEVYRLHALAAAQAQSVPATGAQPWQKPGPVTDVHPLECLIVIQSLRQSDGDWWARGDHFFSADSPLAWMPDTPENSALLTGASPTAPTGSAG